MKSKARSLRFSGFAAMRRRHLVAVVFALPFIVAPVMRAAVCVSVANGPYRAPSTWSCAQTPTAVDDVFVLHSVSQGFDPNDPNNPVSGNLTICGPSTGGACSPLDPNNPAGGSLDLTFLPMSVFGDLVVDNLVTGYSPLMMETGGSTISGSGTIQSMLEIHNSSTPTITSISSGADLTIQNTVYLGNFADPNTPVVLENFGTIRSSSNMAYKTSNETSTYGGYPAFDAMHASSTLVNGATGEIHTWGEFFPYLGTLDATATGNVVFYEGQYGQAVFPTTYDTLKIDNGSIDPNDPYSPRGFAMAAGPITAHNFYLLQGSEFSDEGYGVAGSGGGTISLGPDAAFLIGSPFFGGTTTFPTNFGTFSIDPSSLVQYDSSDPQTIAALSVPYGNLVVLAGYGFPYPQKMGSLAVARPKPPGGGTISSSARTRPPSPNVSAPLITKTLAAGTVQVAGWLGADHPPNGDPNNPLDPNNPYDPNAPTLELDIGSSTLDVGDSIWGEGAITLTSGSLSLGGDFFNRGAFTAGTSTVKYNGNRSQLVRDASYYNLTFNNFGGGAKGGGIATSGGIAWLSGPISIANDLEIMDGGGLSDEGFQITGGSGTLTLGNGSQLYLGLYGNATLLPSFGTYSVHPMSTIRYQATSNAQTISTATSYGRLEVLYDGPSYGGVSLPPQIEASKGRTVRRRPTRPPISVLTILPITKTPTGPGPLVVAGDLDIANDSLDPNNPITLSMGTMSLQAGRIIGNGGLSFSSGNALIRSYENTGVFIAGTGTVTYNGNVGQMRGTSYTNVVIDGSMALTGNANTSGFFIVNSGREINLNGYGIDVNANYTLNGMVSDSSAGSVRVYGSGTGVTGAGMMAAATILYFGGSGQSINGGTLSFGDIILGDPNTPVTVTNNAIVNAVNVIGGNASSQWINAASSGLHVYGGLMSTGTLTATASPNLVDYNGASAQAIKPTTYYDLRVGGGGIKSGAFTSAHDFFVQGTAVFNAGSSSYQIKGAMNVGGGATLDSGTSTFTLNGSASQSLAGAIGFNDLTVDNTSNITTNPGSAISIGGTLNLVNGIFYTGGTTVVAANASRTNGWVGGRLGLGYAGAGSKTLPVGTANGYSPVTVNVTSANGTGSITAEAVQGPHLSPFAGAMLANRFWKLSQSGFATTMNLTFNYLDPTDIVGNESDYVIWKYSEAMWSAPGGTVTPAANSATITGVTLLSDWTVGEAKADLSITKAKQSGGVPGQNIVYTITVTNNGPSAATGVSASDAPGAGLTFVSNAGDCTTSFPCSLGTLANGVSKAITSTWSVAASKTGSITNSATVSTTVADPNSPNNTATATVTATPEADLVISKSGPTSAIPGQNVVYTITVTNNGPSTATGVSVTDTPGAALSFVGNSGACVTTFPCSLGTIAPSTSKVITSTFTIAPAATGTVTNTASVSSAVFDPNLGNNASAPVTTTLGPSANLSLTKAAPASALPGQNVVFTITVTNNGPSTATGISVSDAPGTGLVFVSNSGACTTSFPCSLGTLNPSETATITSTWNTATSATGNVTNSATVSSSTNDPAIGNNTDTATTPVTVCPTLVSLQSPAANATDVSTAGTLSWSSANATSFKVYLGLDGSGCSNLIATTTSSSINYSGLQPDTAYEWRVEALKTGCTTVTSICRKFRTAPPPCENDPPTLVAPAVGAMNLLSPVTFSWNEVSGAVGYNLRTSSSATPTGTTLTTATLTVPAGSHAWWVEALFADCPPAESEHRTFGVRTAEECGDVSPTLNAPDEGATGLASPVTFDWNSVPDATGYRVWVSVDGRFPVIVASTTTATTATASVPSGVLDWFVQALFADCPPTISVQRRLTAVPGTTCPTQTPTLLLPSQDATAASPVTFAWTPVDGAINYALWISIDGSTPSIFGTTPDTSFSRELPAGEIEWFVEAFFDGCPITRSALRNLTVPPPPPCQHDDPALLAPADGAVNQSALMTFEWAAVDEATGYRVFAKSSGGPPELLGTTLNETTLTVLLQGSALEWYVEALFDGCPAKISETRGFTLAPAFSCDHMRPVPISPADGETSAPLVTFNWPSLEGAVGYQIWVSFDDGVASMVGQTTSLVTTLTREMAVGTNVWRVRALFTGCTPVESMPRTLHVELAAECAARKPVILSPQNGTTGITSPVHFVWSGVDGATGYRLWQSYNRGEFQQVGATLTTTSATVPVATGLLEWYVEALLSGCPPVASRIASMTVVSTPPCGVPGRPVARVVGRASVNETYEVFWTPVAGATIYEVQESSTGSFTGAPTQVVRGTFLEFVHDTAGTYMYRVRAISDCAQERGPYSTSISTVVSSESSSGQAGDVGDLVETIWLCLGDGGQVVVCSADGLAKGAAPADGTGVTVTLVTTQPWQTISPSSATVTAQPTPVTVTSSTATLPPGSSTSTLTATPATGAAPTTVPTSVSLATPVAPTPRNEPQPNSLIIPAIAHTKGANGSTWRSDVRVTNTGAQAIDYSLNFTPAGYNGTQTGLQTTVEIQPGLTIALDDILTSWFGQAGAGATGVLEIRPLGTDPKNFASFASSRTYNLTTNGTLGQYMPAVSYSEFVGKTNDGSGTLGLQQISESEKMRTNIGIVEASGHAVDVMVRVFDAAGTNLGEIPLSLQAGEHRQFNRILADAGIDMDDGRVTIDVTSDEGKITAYASVIDNATNDPFVVPAVHLGRTVADRYVVPGVADIFTGQADWRTDMRILNDSSAPVVANLTFFAENNPDSKKTIQVTLGAGEIAVLDDLLRDSFDLRQAVGAIHITTDNPTPLVVTARTYNKAATGTYGLFTPGVTAERAVGVGERALQILQVEESSRFRANLGISEVTGNPVTVKVQAIVPGALAAPTMLLSLRPNEFTQRNAVLKSLGLSEVYNARLLVQAVDGTGKIVAYGSIIDNTTQDPTYVPSQ